MVGWSVGWSVRNKLTFFINISYTISRTLTKLGLKVDIDEIYLSVKGQGRWLKGQGQIQDFSKIGCDQILVLFIGL